ncbi:hypothetical protein PAEPH01_2246 [Pancytospora epiphaga]|nr:hypothetical protein PAEPH01_2246 [Pancytospora epiphaga]
MTQLKLVFPFSVEGMSSEALIDVPLERNLSLISFALQYDLSLTIQNAELIKKSYKAANTIYVFEFENLDQALEWMENPSAYVVYGSRNCNVEVLEKEMNEYMQTYETKEKGLRKRKIVEDEDGFMHYE